MTKPLAFEVDSVPRYPWEQPEQLPAPASAATLPAVPVEDTVRLLQRDMAYMVTHTAVQVHSSHKALQILVNTARGQIIPHGECKLSDGTALELQDIGMPQPGAPAMTVAALLAQVWGVVRSMGLELQT